MAYSKKIFGFSIIILALMTSCKGHGNKGVNPDEMPASEVDVAEVITDSVMIFKEYPGQLSAKNKVEIVGKVDGTLKSCNYNAGDVVKAGQVLFTIDDTQYRNAVQQAQGQLNNALSEKEYYSKQYAAMTKAFQSDAVSEMELLQAKSNLEESEASIMTARANLETAKTNLGYCIIRAPFTGRITAGVYSPGTYIAGSAQPVTLATLYDNSDFYADFFIEDATYIELTSGQNPGMKEAFNSIPITFSEQMAHDYTGKLDYIAPDINTTTGTMKVRAVVRNEYDELRDGMYLKVSLPYRSYPNAILVEDSAIGTEQTGKYVYVVNEKDETIYTPVKTGALTGGNMRVIESGLKPGQRYVTKALLKVKNGMKVKPKMTE